jgi:hypothetical protein
LSSLLFRVISFFVRGILSPLLFRVTFFFVKGLFESLVFFGVASFFITCPFEPFPFFGVASFFIGGLFDSLAFFGVASFFIRGLFEPLREGPDSTHSLMASLFKLNNFFEYRASLASDFDVANSMFRGIEAYIAASVYMSSASLKTSHPHGLPL